MDELTSHELPQGESGPTKMILLEPGASHIFCGLMGTFLTYGD
jgi:hypothetical protein